MSSLSALIIDDEDGLRDIYREYFQIAGYADVQTAPDGLEAFALCAQKKYDVITLDHRMPMVKGADFLRALRKKAGPNQQTPVLMISGFIPEFRETVEMLEHTFFLDKPIDLEKFTKYVNLIKATKR